MGDDEPRGSEHGGLDLEGRICRQLGRVRGAWGVTSAQARVLGLLVSGLSNKEIANALDTAEATTEAHVTQLLRRSGTQNRTALVTAFWIHP